ncbi:MAG: hypothetical protein HY527_19130 [Betaproteobacteria bacterium]|nr:hypothetical protein [Betaproteobacteria bacterium]
MLRLWRERVLVSLAPAEISWLRLAGGLKRRVQAKRMIGIDPAYGAEPWQGAVAALRAEVEAWRNESVNVTIVLSNHFMRYVVVPASDGVSGVDEAQALVRFHFSKVHGERCRNWDVRLSDARARAPQLACAIDAGLLPALRACFPREARPRLVSVQPYLMSAFNCWRRQFPVSGAWLLLLEAERACLALIAGRHWVTVQNVKGSYDHPDEWANLMDRERWRVNLEQVPETVLVHTPRPAGTALPHDGGWKLLVNNTFWPAGLALPKDWGYAAALTAI